MTGCDGKTVSNIGTGRGKTEDDAINAAAVDAIQQNIQDCTITGGCGTQSSPGICSYDIFGGVYKQVGETKSVELPGGGNGFEAKVEGKGKCRCLGINPGGPVIS